MAGRGIECQRVTNLRIPQVLYARRDKSELLYVDIPRDFVAESEEPFDREKMKRLFNIGMELGRSSDPWSSSIPEVKDDW